ncbi:MAG: phosphoribosylanthranilate isomerase [Woeseiaceae bacterium]
MATLVKICGMTDSAAVRAAVAAEADAIGFVFFSKSPRNVSAQQARQLAADIPKHIRRVAVMLHPDVALWHEVESVFCPDVLQTDAEDFSYLNVAAGIEKWPVIREGSVRDDMTFPETFVYEGQKSGFGETVNWTIAAGIAHRGNMILAGGLDIENVGEAIRQVAPFGVDVSSAVESEQGKKDVVKIAAFVAAARSATNHNATNHYRQGRP